MEKCLDHIRAVYQAGLGIIGEPRSARQDVLEECPMDRPELLGLHVLRRDHADMVSP